MQPNYNAQSITYDDIGNPLTYNNGTSYVFTWEGRNLVGAVVGTGTSQKTITFTYNDEGIRTSKTVNGVKYTYILDGSQIVGELWEDKAMLYIYDANGSPIGMQYREGTYAEGKWDAYTGMRKICMVM